METLYTETLAKWLENGNLLPTNFSDIPSLNNVSFATMFTQHFKYREIGDEDEDVFKDFLQDRAYTVIPNYKDKIAKLMGTNGLLANPLNYTMKTEVTIGQKSASYPKPADLDDLSNTEANDAVTNSTTQEVNETRPTFRDIKIDSVKKYLELKDVYELLLDEFDTCFMQIF